MSRARWGVALGDRNRGVNRHIVATIGDGSFQYSIQAIWTAAQHKLPIVFVVLRNGAYEILKSFALLENTPHVPATGSAWSRYCLSGNRFRMPYRRRRHYRITGARTETALDADGPTVIVVQTQPEMPHLG